MIPDLKIPEKFRSYLKDWNMFLEVRFLEGTRLRSGKEVWPL
jgi:hypothetical protein